MDALAVIPGGGDLVFVRHPSRLKRRGCAEVEVWDFNRDGSAVENRNLGKLGVSDACTNLVKTRHQIDSEFSGAECHLLEVAIEDADFGCPIGGTHV